MVVVVPRNQHLGVTTTRHAASKAEHSRARRHPRDTHGERRLAEHASRINLVRAVILESFSWKLPGGQMSDALPETASPSRSYTKAEDAPTQSCSVAGGASLSRRALTGAKATLSNASASCKALTGAKAKFSDVSGSSRRALTGAKAKLSDMSGSSRRAFQAMSPSRQSLSERVPENCGCGSIRTCAADWAADGFYRTADLFTILTLAGVSMQWHKRFTPYTYGSHMRSWVALVMLLAAVGIGVPVHTWFTDGMGSFVDYVSHDLGSALSPRASLDVAADGNRTAGLGNGLGNGTGDGGSGGDVGRLPTVTVTIDASGSRASASTLQSLFLRSHPPDLI